ncbi:hypothetical protein H2200_004493 [Cladophialophora chaetospira]|uniref:Glycine zipper 2TM domain-containing protein n=1 Tax=Cladophialophora chaetospira TaxID=386627 RepID=A0AA38XDV9_9EURO|nr:hypothetical protein H2200_004493 [Cladophialophora chaetospira]
MSGSYHYADAQNSYNYNTQHQPQSSYPSEGFSNQYQQPYYNPQNYYPDTRSNAYPDTGYAQSASNASYYNNSTPNPQGPEADRGLLGAAAGGAAGAFGGHKVGHGVLGALGGAILGSLTEDYAKKGKKGKHGKHNKHGHGHRDSASSNGPYASGGLGSVASSFFNRK